MQSPAQERGARARLRQALQLGTWACLVFVEHGELRTLKPPKPTPVDLFSNADVLWAGSRAVLEPVATRGRRAQATRVMHWTNTRRLEAMTAVDAAVDAPVDVAIETATHR